MKSSEAEKRIRVGALFGLARGAQLLLIVAYGLRFFKKVFYVLDFFVIGAPAL